MCGGEVRSGVSVSCSPLEPWTPLLAAVVSRWCTCPAVPAVME